MKLASIALLILGVQGTLFSSLWDGPVDGDKNPKHPAPPHHPRPPGPKEPHPAPPGRFCVSKCKKQMHKCFVGCKTDFSSDDDVFDECKRECWTSGKKCFNVCRNGRCNEDQEFDNEDDE